MRWKELVGTASTIGLIISLIATKNYSHSKERSRKYFSQKAAQATLDYIDNYIGGNFNALMESSIEAGCDSKEGQSHNKSEMRHKIKNLLKKDFPTNEQAISTLCQHINVKYLKIDDYVKRYVNRIESQKPSLETIKLPHFQDTVNRVAKEKGTNNILRNVRLTEYCIAKPLTNKSFCVKNNLHSDYQTLPPEYYSVSMSFAQNIRGQIK